MSVNTSEGLADRYNKDELKKTFETEWQVWRWCCVSLIVFQAILDVTEKPNGKRNFFNPLGTEFVYTQDDRSDNRILSNPEKTPSVSDKMQ